MPPRIDFPLLPKFTRRFPEKALSSLTKVRTPGPTPTHTFVFNRPFQEDSPLLPHFARITSTHTITGGAYPSPLQQRTFLFSPSVTSFASSSSSASASPTDARAKRTARMSDYLPSDADFFPEDDAYLADWHITPPQVQGEWVLLLADQAAILPVVGRRRVEYEPDEAMGSYVVLRQEDREGSLELGKRERLREWRGERAFSLRNWARKVLVKWGDRREVKV